MRLIYTFLFALLSLLPAASQITPDTRPSVDVSTHEQFDKSQSAVEALTVSVATSGSEQSPVTLQPDPVPPSPVRDPKTASKETLTPDHLRLVGGWRIPPLSEQRGSQFVSTAKARGLAVKRTKDGYQIWLAKSPLTGEVLQFEIPKNPTQGSNPGVWSKASLVRNLGPVYREVQATDKQIEIFGLTYDDKGNRVLVSGRSVYAQNEQTSRFIVPFDVETGEVGKPFGGPKLNMPRHGGGFVDVPKDFQEQFGVHHIAAAKGGYESGQGSAANPTCVTLDGTRLLDSRWKAPPEEREHRDTNYSDPGNIFSWGISPTKEYGYMSTDLVHAAAWVQTKKVEGLCYWLDQPTGAIDYDLQTKHLLAPGFQHSIYIYDRNQLEQSARGEVEPTMVRGDYSLFRPTHTRGAWFDTETDRLFLLQQWQWRPHPSSINAYPAIFVYEIVSQ